MQIVTCLAYADGTLYVGLDTGVVKIYNYVDAPQANSKKRFEVRAPPCRHAPPTHAPTPSQQYSRMLDAL